MNTSERRAVAALWSLRGVGPVSIAAIEERFPLGELLEKKVSAWAPLIDLPPTAREALGRLETLEPCADALERKAKEREQQVLFPGDAGWPSRLEEISGAPRVLFMVGPGASARPRKRVALVGTRHPESGFEEKVRGFAEELVRAGVGVISGAAEGVDRAAHLGALDGQGETWAFLGSAIDQMDAGQRFLQKLFRDGAGTFYSQYPPGSRPDQSTFSRRNRLISGASDLVLVARAGTVSGALHTARAAIDQKRPLLVIPSNPWNPAAKGSNALLREHASVCLEARDVLDALELTGVLSGLPPPHTPMGPISAQARQVLDVLERTSCDVDELRARVGLSAAAISTALLELEIEGAVQLRGAGRWEKV